MPVDPLVLELLEEVESGKTPEEACAAHPNLLEEVRARLERLGRVRDELDALFPGPGQSPARISSSPPSFTPEIPGHAIESVLGRGGMGVVYKARHLRLNRPVAVKMMLNGGHAGPPELARFLREAEALAAVGHPNIVRIYEVGDVDGLPYFTMEYVEGETLAERLGGIPIPADRASALLAILAGAMQAAHAVGIVHRDLKPANVLMAIDGVPKITDFGLAWRYDTGVALTRTGVRVGTPSYMSPEQAAGHSVAFGPATDIYALGAILYEMLTGRPPFRAATGAETERQVIHDDPVPPRSLNSRVPRDLETICRKCLNKDPRHRYPDAGALAKDLHRFLNGEAIEARPESGLERLARKARRRPGTTAAIAAGLPLSMILVVGGLWISSERRAAERATDEDLREMAASLERSAWPEARASLERARGRSGRSGTSARLRQILAQRDRELKLVARLDAIRLDRAGTIGGVYDSLPSVREYRSAFQEAGFGTPDERPEVVAPRVEASSIKRALIAVLDDWALNAVDDAHEQAWALAVARICDRDPTGWRDRARDPATWGDKAKLAGVLKDAPIADGSIPLLLAIEGHWSGTGEDSIPFLKQILRDHPGDFWVNLRAGDVLRERDEFAEAARFYQAAMAIRPDAALACSDLGIVVANSGRRDEALELFRRALRIDPKSAPYHHNLAYTLLDLGRAEEALEHSRLANRFSPRVALMRHVLGRCLAARGLYQEAFGEYRQAIALNPTDILARTELRSALMRERRFDEAMTVWGQALEAISPKHEHWYGYAELCLFLGRGEEYRRARQRLLSKFSSSDDPVIAERTARACLLLPDSDEQLRKVMALGKKAWEANREEYPSTFPFFEFLRGLAEYRQGHFDTAIDLMRGEAAGILGPAPVLLLAMALQEAGRVTEAQETLASAVKAHDWHESKVKDQDDWIFHSLRREAETLILQGSTTRPKDVNSSGGSDRHPAP